MAMADRDGPCHINDGTVVTIDGTAVFSDATLQKRSTLSFVSEL